jgi:23S rRNA pseudouridine2605 synthase
MRINRYLAQCGLGSRRACEEVVKAGRVSINDKPITELFTTIDELTDIVRVDGNIVRAEQKELYVLLNKPKGIVTTAHDERGRKTVFDLVKTKERLFTVGRLDTNSEGLLLLTNNGEVAHRLMHPRYKVVKTYRVKLDRRFSPSDFAALTSGLKLEDGWTLPCEAGFYTENTAQIEIHLREGRNHQVRRMFESLGYKVKALRRVKFGPFTLENLKAGEWRNFDQQEVSKIKSLVKL